MLHQNDWEAYQEGWIKTTNFFFYRSRHCHCSIYLSIAQHKNWTPNHQLIGTDALLLDCPISPVLCNGFHHGAQYKSMVFLPESAYSCAWQIPDRPLKQYEPWMSRHFLTSLLKPIWALRLIYRVSNFSHRLFYRQIHIFFSMLSWSLQALYNESDTTFTIAGETLLQIEFLLLHG